jgi:hypothetical protein
MKLTQLDAARRRHRRLAGEGPMPDVTSIELSEREAARLTTTLAVDVRRLVTGALFIAAVTAVGTALVTLALAVAVVGSPLVAAALVWVVVRRHRAQRLQPGLGAAT